jgi:hypothetical protein
LKVEFDLFAELFRSVTVTGNDGCTVMILVTRSQSMWIPDRVVIAEMDDLGAGARHQGGDARRNPE